MSNFVSNIGLLIFTVLGLGFTFFFVKSMQDRTKFIPENIRNIERTLSQAGFIISRKIGGIGTKCDAHYFLYVDDTNKKWLLTSPFLHEPVKIRNFDDLLDYEFFDEDGSDITGKITKGFVGTAGAIGGVAVGGIVGGVVGGMAGKKAATILPHMNGESRAFGFLIRTKDCTANNPVLIFDFYNVVKQSMENNGNISDKILGTFDTVTKGGVGRNSLAYKKDIAAIQKMAEVFDYIITSNTQN